jgi:hypothetical protein
MQNNAPPSDRVQAQLRQGLGLVPSWRVDQSMGVVAMKRRLTAVLLKTGHQLERPRKQTGGSRQRVTYIAVRPSQANAAAQPP